MSKNKHLINEDEALQTALSPIVNKLIDKNFEDSQDKIATQIAPLIGVAIRKQIKSQKDDIVDALYPIMGNMISRFVTKSLEELLNRINNQIQNGLSIEALKRKVKAKIKGVSESEILLQENSNAKIKAILLIHKESGTLLTKIENKNYQLNDPDMLASMMSAIRSFVNEWINSNSNYQELAEIEYGENKIILESSGYSYIAVIVEGATDKNIYADIREALEKIVLQYGKKIKNFSGDFKSFPKEEINGELSKILPTNTQINREKKKLHPSIVIIPLMLLGWGGYTLYSNYVDKQLSNKLNEALYKTPQLTLFRLNVTVKDNIALLVGNVPFKYHKELSQNVLKKIDSSINIKNEIIVTPTLTDPMQISSNISYLVSGLNQNKDIAIRYSYDYNTLTLDGNVVNKKTMDDILIAMKKIDGIDNIHNSIKIMPPNIDENIYFNKSSSKLTLDAQIKLINLINKLKFLDSDYVLVTTAYSDMIGSQKQNTNLAKKRLKNISLFIHKQIKLQNPLQSTILNRSPAEIDYLKEPKNARCVNISIGKI